MSASDDLACLYSRAPTVPVSDADRYVVFSDLHLGDGGRNDDFRRNADMFLTLLRDHYWSNGYNLILNGDVEELERFNLESVRRRWTDFYDLLKRFSKAGRLHKIFGNHDFLFSTTPTIIKPFRVVEALRLVHSEGEMFVFHGHQTGRFLERPNVLVRYGLRYVANPLGINNKSAAHDSRKRYRTEKRIYEFSRSRKVISIIGHTHRPLFESLSKLDALTFAVENLCRDYVSASDARKFEIEESIHDYRAELESLSRKEIRRSSTSTLYAANIVIPCLFNSGCVIGKRGITGIEIGDGEVSLVHWFDANVSSKYLNYHGHTAERLGSTDYYRNVLNRDRLSYIFSRIKLLA